MKSFSIIILTYNCEDVIIDNLNRLLMQNFPNDDYEVIIIDDKSRDKTVFFVSNFVSKHVCFRFYPQNQNHGNGYCKNLGIKLAQSSIVFFLDDHLKLTDNNTIVKMYNFLHENPEFVGVCGSYVSAHKSDYNICRDIRRFTLYEKNDKDLILSLEKFIPFSIVISALNLDNIDDEQPFPSDFKQNAAEDVMFQLQEHAMGKNFAFLSDIVAEHNHDATLRDLLRKSIRELRGFSYVVEHNLNKNNLRSIYLPCFFSFPLFFWLTVFLSVLLPFSGYMAALFLLLEIIIISKIFTYSIDLKSRCKSFLYCFINEIFKIVYIVKIGIVRYKQLPTFILLLIHWELNKLKYVYENKFK